MYKPKLQKHAKSCSYVNVHCTDAHMYIHVLLTCTNTCTKSAKLASYTKHTANYANVHVVKVYACDYASGV